ncbi:hypothetical protein FZC76_21795 [Sutcliffiella horikoshii]|uniref:Uncharacterized protein n=1 Tax=Sutcliffiella horikoshii TaxID=79883 RepID=A0A5D4SFD0_9BACI|nr:hypothetical protein [Sutcliffiella horikoshii]TYS60506.1 hypothetical protein FZC76_21795 [Sutcliffiella horikoshii]
MKKPNDFDMFLAMATDVFIQKDTDYDSRFMRGMMKLDARTLWEWEVDKKLDRLRTWLTRGELLVKEEGVENSVVDLFNYTVQYVYYVQVYVNGMNYLKPHNIQGWQEKRERNFYHVASKLKPEEWVKFLESKGRIQKEERVLKALLLEFMGA